ncbi:MAG TPA: tRNA (adenosine(37)-N6)-dimethylallyltransferase MiaA [Planctomycetaceae bacterium]|nr:tRNA (adenosine(37)-N6)-dimethylallyltransferase MiaA [Planctomycetaceae bacterium]
MNVFYLTGPTGAGKTALGIEFALKIGAEIISMDSMAVYRGMEIGTAVPTAEERARVPHHLVGFRDPACEYSLADYLRDARAVAGEVLGRGKRVLYVGGTPLYLKALLRGLFEGPPADAAFREEMFHRAVEQPPGWLHERLCEVDRRTADRLHPNDTRRIIRALEVYRTTGTPISVLQRQFDRPVPREDCRVYVLDRPREILYDRINGRVGAMLEAGLLEEARALWERLRDIPNATAAQAVGYRELFGYFEAQETLLKATPRETTARDDAPREETLSETLEAIRRHSRQFAKRQGTWFRSLSECRFVSPSELETVIRGPWRAVGGSPPRIVRPRVHGGRLNAEDQ